MTGTTPTEIDKISSPVIHSQSHQLQHKWRSAHMVWHKTSLVRWILQNQTQPLPLAILTSDIPL